nr:uncharacterized protein LOC101883054 [Danio rerio]|eukprot:XP_005171086.2 uncharacterized protein LOC101883054 [Danio rerio]
MSVRMAAPLTLVLLLMIHRVYGQSGYDVSYSSTNICALKGSTVTMGCTFRHPYGSYVSKAFWTKFPVIGREYLDLFVDPEYRQRLQYLGDKQQNCAVRLSDLTYNDEHQYYFGFITNKDASWIGTPGVFLSVTDLQVESPERVKEGDSVSLTCKTSCELTDTPTFIWYRNSETLIKGSVQNEIIFRSFTRGHAGYYSCGVQGHKYISPAVYLDVTLQQGASRKRSVIAVTCGGLFIVILLFMIRMKRMNRRSAVNEYENVDLSANTYAGLDPQSRSPDLYNTLTTPSPAAHQTSSSEYENMSANGRSAVDLH